MSEHVSIFPKIQPRTKTAGAVVGMLAALELLSGCGDGTQVPSSAPSTSEVVTNYRGRDIICLQSPNTDGAGLYTCDFTAFYNDPDFVAPPDTTRLPEGFLTEVTVTYRGKPLHCLKFLLVAGGVGQTCDFERFHTENQ